MTKMPLKAKKKIRVMGLFCPFMIILLLLLSQLMGNLVFE